MPLPSSAQATTTLIGREAESRVLTYRILAAKSGNGGALVVRGAPGIGKTSVLHAAKADALAAGLQVLTTTGIQSETRLPFAGLHQLLGPVLRDVDRLPVTYGKALQSAFGLIDDPVSGSHLVAMSMLQLLGESAERGPIALLVDDAQWLDGSTAEALAFVARRLESDPIVLISAIREGYESPFLRARIPELRVEALSDKDAMSLLDSRSPQMVPRLRERVMRESAGNPLALVELSISLRELAGRDFAGETASLPLTKRLELAFADRLSSLSPDARVLVQIAAIDESEALDELLDTASKFRGHEITDGAAAEAGGAGFVILAADQLRLRHPLMRSAIQQSMTPEVRRATHGVLAATLGGDSERGVWHRAAAVLGKSEPVTSELETVAARARRRGAAGTAMVALERAAQLAGDPMRRGSLLIRATFNALAM